MTMRLDIVNNDAGELIRRERARELGADVVVELYKLIKLVMVHELNNDAMTRQREQTYQVIQDYCLKSGFPVTVLFAERAVFVGAQLLRGSKSVYDAALELGSALEKLGGSEVTITKEITREDLAALSEAFSAAFRSGRGGFRSPTPRFRLRPVNDAARLRGLDLENLSEHARIVRMYASAVVILRRFHEDLGRSRYVMPRRLKRVAQSLVDLSLGNTPAFLGVTEVRNANEDDAGRAVNAAILAVAMARELTADRRTLAQISVAAMMYDVSKPRALARLAGDGMLVAALSEDQEDQLPAGSAAVLTALGRVNEPTITRTVITFEALWLRRTFSLGELYGGVRSPTLQAKIVHLARSYNDRMVPEPGLLPKTAERAVAELYREATLDGDRTLVRLLVAALGIVPAGTVVKLSSGEVCEVVPRPHTEGSFEGRPLVRVVMNARGAATDGPEIDLAEETGRAIVKVISIDGWARAAEESAPELLPHVDNDELVQEEERFAERNLGDDRRAEHEVDGAWSVAPARAAFDSSAPSVARPTFMPEPMEVESSSTSDLRASPSEPAPAAPVLSHFAMGLPETHRHAESDEALAVSTSDARALLESEVQPVAEGTLEATPVSHLLVYMLEHMLSGTVVFQAPGGPLSSIYFIEGAPAQAHIAFPSPRIGDILVEHGWVGSTSLQNAVNSARSLGLLLGEFLVGEELLSRQSLDRALTEQLLGRLNLLANLDPDTAYAFYADINTMANESHGSEVFGVKPLQAIHGVVRATHDRSRINATLRRVARYPLRLHPRANVQSMRLDPDERKAVQRLLRDAPTAAELLDSAPGADSMLYTLIVTRQVALAESDKLPMNPRAADAPSHASLLPETPLSFGLPRSAPRIAVAPSLARDDSGAPRTLVNRSAIPPAAMPPASMPSEASAAPISAPRMPSIGPRRPLIRPVSLTAPRGEAARSLATSPRAVSLEIARNTAATGAESVSESAAEFTAESTSESTFGTDGYEVDRTVAAKPDQIRAALRTLHALTRADAPNPTAQTSDVNRAHAEAATGGGHSALQVPTSSASGSRMPKPTPAADPLFSEPSPSMHDAPNFSESAHLSDSDGDSLGLGDDEDELSVERAIEAMTAYRQAETALARGDLDDASQLANRALLCDPSRSEHRALATWVAQLRNEITDDAAVTAYTVLLNEDPACVVARLFRARSHLRNRRVALARADYMSILERDPEHVEARRELRRM